MIMQVNEFYTQYRRQGITRENQTRSLTFNVDNRSEYITD